MMPSSWEEAIALVSDEWRATWQGVPDDQRVTVGNIQWKGTDVCMDISCSCGSSGHIDGMFAHQVKCLGCGRSFVLHTVVQMTEVAYEPDGCCIEFGDPDEDDEAEDGGG